MKKVAYDCRNRLIEAKTDSGEATKYAYDAENVRIKVIKNAGTQKESITTYVTDSVSDDLSRVLQAETVDKNGTTETTLYTYGKGLIAQEKGAEYLLYHFDHLGSTTAVTDVGGEIKYTYAYNIFGKLLSGNYGEVEFLYNGQYGVTSDANGLYYMRARYYNIDIMRFINQDILTGSIDSSQSLNRYAYVEGNPVNFLDPFGLEPLLTEDLHFWASVTMTISGFGINTTVGLVTFVGTFAFDTGVYINDLFTSGFDLDVIAQMFFSTLENLGGAVLSGALKITTKTSVIITSGKVVDKGATIKSIVSALDGLSDRIGDWVIKGIDAIIDPLIEKQLEKERNK